MKLALDSVSYMPSKTLNTIIRYFYSFFFWRSMKLALDSVSYMPSQTLNTIVRYFYSFFFGGR